MFCITDSLMNLTCHLKWYVLPQMHGQLAPTSADGSVSSQSRLTDTDCSERHLQLHTPFKPKIQLA